MKFISVKCPECKAELSISENRTFCFCEYCGTKIMCVNENEHTYTHNHTCTRVDEADLIRAETERIVALNKIEKERREQKAQQRRTVFGFVGQVLKFLCKMVVVIVLLFLVLVGIIAFVAGPYELGFVGLGAAGILWFMWDHRKGKK